MDRPSLRTYKHGPATGNRWPGHVLSQILSHGRASVEASGARDAASDTNSRSRASPWMTP